MPQVAKIMDTKATTANCSLSSISKLTSLAIKHFVAYNVAATEGYCNINVSTATCNCCSSKCVWHLVGKEIFITFRRSCESISTSAEKNKFFFLFFVLQNVKNMKITKLFVNKNLR